MDTFNQEWDALIPRLAKAYIGRFYHFNYGPQFKETAVNPQQPLCDCAEPRISFLKVDCIYMTGKTFDSFGIYYITVILIMIINLGIVKDQHIPYCSNCHKEEPIALLNNNLLAASPTRPSMEFHVCLLQFYSKLRGHGQTTVQAFSTTLSHVFGYQVSIVHEDTW